MNNLIHKNQFSRNYNILHAARWFNSVKTFKIPNNNIQMQTTTNQTPISHSYQTHITTNIHRILIHLTRAILNTYINCLWKQIKYRFIAVFLNYIFVLNFPTPSNISSIRPLDFPIPHYFRICSFLPISTSLTHDLPIGYLHTHNLLAIDHHEIQIDIYVHNNFIKTPSDNRIKKIAEHQ